MPRTTAKPRAAARRWKRNRERKDRQKLLAHAEHGNDGTCPCVRPDFGDFDCREAGCRVCAEKSDAAMKDWYAEIAAAVCAHEGCSRPIDWKYDPSRDGDDSIYGFCDDHVDRGCNCNYTYQYDDDGERIVDSGVPDLDEQGRELPCCEWSRVDRATKLRLRRYRFEYRHKPKLNMPKRKKVRRGLAMKAPSPAHLDFVDVDKLMLDLRAHYGDKKVDDLLDAAAAALSGPRNEMTEAEWEAEMEAFVDYESKQKE